MDYNGIHMQSYFIQYPPIYPNCGTSQRPIVFFFEATGGVQDSY